MTRLTPTTILYHACEVAAERGRADAQAYAARELRILGIDWESLPDTTQQDFVAHLERVAPTPKEQTG
jgi:hypothetical protein